MQNYSNKDYEFLGRQVAAGRYVGRNVCFLALILAFLLGLGLGRYAFPDADRTAAQSGGAKRPLGQNSAVADAANPSKQVLESIFQHEEELRKNPQDADAWEHLGNLYFDAQEPEKAIRAYEKALELKPGNTNVLVDCGVMYRQIKNYAKALEFFEKALAIKSEHQNALFNSGVVLYFDLERKEEALANWRKLVAINPNAKTPSGDLVSKLISELSR